MPQEILIPEEITTNELDQKIENALVKENVTEKVIRELKEKYSGLRLRDLDDKETYLEIKTARREVGKVRIIAEKICKRGREDALRVQRLWVSKEKEVVKKIAEVEDVLKAEEDRFDAEVERKERQAQQQREEQFADRQRQLLKFGAHYENGSYNLNHISYDSQTLKDADDEIWHELIYPKYAAEFQKNEQARVEEEKKRQQEIAAIKAEREKMELEQQEFRKQQDELRQHWITLRSQQEEVERANRLAEQKRLDELAAAEAEQLRQQKQQEWDAGAGERLLKLAKEAKEQAERELEIKQQQQIEKQAEERATASDKENWPNLVNELKTVLAGYQMKSPVYRRKFAITKEKIEEISEL